MPEEHQGIFLVYFLEDFFQWECWTIATKITQNVQIIAVLSYCFSGQSVTLKGTHNAHHCHINTFLPK